MQHWGVVEHHNAMVFDLEAAESPDEKEEPKVLDKFIFIYYYYWLVQHFEFVREENVKRQVDINFFIINVVSCHCRLGFYL